MASGKKNLLLVEDDPNLRTLLSTILRNSGFRVRAAADGFEALSEIRAEMPDVVLSDLYMVGMSGFELLSVVRRRFPGIVVIAMSSAFTGGEVPAGVAADAFYQKATSIPTLLELIEVVGQIESAPAARADSTPPIWIAADAKRAAAEDPIVIGCPECLRTFAHAPETGTEVVRSTECVYCTSGIRYAMVQTVDPGPPGTYLRTTDGAGAGGHCSAGFA